MKERKHIIGFGTYQAPPPPPEPDKETEDNLVEQALDQYLIDYKPYDPDDEVDPQDFKTSREIQEALSDMVTISISTITKYMNSHGYDMVNVEGGGLTWHLQRDDPF